MAVERRPLTTEELPAGAAKVAGPAAPGPVKLMAARGMAPGLSATADLNITSPRGASGYIKFEQYDGDDDSFEVKVNPGEFGTTTKLSMNPEEGMILSASYWSVQATTASITVPTLHAIGKLTVGDNVAAAGYLHIEGSSTDNFIYIKNAQDRPAWFDSTSHTGRVFACCHRTDTPGCPDSILLRSRPASE